MIKYSYLSIRNDAAKIMIILFAAIVCKRLIECLLFLSVFMIIRSLQGGLHSRNFLGCLLLSGLWIAAGIWISCIAEYNHRLIYGLTVISIIVPALYGPIPSNRHRKLTAEMRKRKKRKDLAIQVALLVIILIPVLNSIQNNCICMGILINNLQLLIMQIKRGKEVPT